MDLKCGSLKKIVELADTYDAIVYGRMNLILQVSSVKPEGESPN